MFFSRFIVVFFSLFSSLSMLSAALTPWEQAIDKDGWDSLYFKVSRLSVMLNKNYESYYFWSKGYPNLGDSFFNCIADVDLDRNNFNNPTIVVTMYLRPYLPIEEREVFAFKLRYFILKLCREFIFEQFSDDNLKLIVKHIKIKETNNNTLFTWDKTGPTYSPRFFEPEFLLETDKIEEHW